MHEALLEAGKTRLRPIVMTTATMVFGMMPLALALGAGSEMRQGMAVVVMGGLLSSTLLTLAADSGGLQLRRWFARTHARALSACPVGAVDALETASGGSFRVVGTHPIR